MLIAFALASCQSSWREQPPPWTADSLANAEYARIQVRDGRVTELRSPSLGSNASGTFVSGDLVSAKQTGEHMVNVPLTDITRLETRGSDSMKVPLLVVALVIVVLGVLSASGVSLTIGI
jgi:hypothetical protein